MFIFLGGNSVREALHVIGSSDGPNQLLHAQHRASVSSHSEGTGVHSVADASFYNLLWNSRHFAAVHGITFSEDTARGIAASAMPNAHLPGLQALW